MTNQTFLKKLQSGSRIAIFGHADPDPDAYGAMFSMREICRVLGKQAEIFAVRGGESSMDEIFPLDEVKTDFRHEDFDLLVFVDMHMFKRLAPCFVDEVKKSKNILIMDHHTITGEEKIISENCIIDSKSAATCELLTQFMVANKLDISPKTATYLWTGIVGDTGRFLFGNTDINVFKTAIKLIECGADIQFVYDKMFNSTPYRLVKLEKIVIDKMKFVCDGKAGYIMFTMKEMKKLGISKEDVKSFTDFMRSIKGVEMSFLIYEVKKNRFKFSLRANGLDCRSLALKMNGGGHYSAAAFVLDAKPSYIKKMIPVWAEEIVR